MKIQSKFKDYYDFVSTRYGQDPGVVYERKPLKLHEVPAPRRYFRDTMKTTPGYHMQFIVAGPHVVPVLYQDSGETFISVLLPHYEHLLGRNWDGTRMMPQLPEGQRLHDLIREVGAPVFRIRRNDGKSLWIAQNIPVLGDMGFPAMVSPGQMWQDIYTTLTTVLRRDPDKEVPVTLSNDARVHKAGFDLKSSFRHPVNAKRPKRPKKAR